MSDDDLPLVANKKRKKKSGSVSKTASHIRYNLDGTVAGAKGPLRTQDDIPDHMSGRRKSRKQIDYTNMDKDVQHSSIEPTRSHFPVA